MIKIFKLTVALAFFTQSLCGQVKTKQQEVYDKIVKANLQHPRIVLKQAIHESGNFKSSGARNKNNILGLMKKGNLRRFDSIDDCIIFYRDNIQNRYTGGDYYRFLKRIGYATDTRYVPKVKNIPLELYLE